MNPFWYRVVQRAAVPNRTRLLKLIRRLAVGARCLDVGCGPDSWLARAGLNTVGVDRSVRSAAALRRAGSPAVAACASALPFADGVFDSVCCFGLVHHVDDDVARSAIAEMIRVTRAGGRTVVFDGVPPLSFWRRPVAALIRAADRGHFLRTAERLGSLVCSIGKWRVHRVTYSCTGLEALICLRCGARTRACRVETHLDTSAEAPGVARSGDAARRSACAT